MYIYQIKANGGSHRYSSYDSCIILSGEIGAHCKNIDNNKKATHVFLRWLSMNDRKLCKSASLCGQELLMRFKC